MLTLFLKGIWNTTLGRRKQTTTVTSLPHLIVPSLLSGFMVFGFWWLTNAPWLLLAWPQLSLCLCVWPPCRWSLQSRGMVSLPSLSPTSCRGDRWDRGVGVLWGGWVQTGMSEEVGLGEKVMVSPPVSAGPPPFPALGLGSMAKTPLSGRLKKQLPRHNTVLRHSQYQHLKS